MIGVSEHPLSDLVIAGESVNPLPTVFHTLLQTIADLMLLPPLGEFVQLLNNSWCANWNKHFEEINNYQCRQERNPCKRDL